jgi:hypothetical protein
MLAAPAGCAGLAEAAGGSCDGLCAAAAGGQHASAAATTPSLRSQAAPANNRSRRTSKKSFIMGQEDSVYLAKLAEQAERYEGA